MLIIKSKDCSCEHVVTKTRVEITGALSEAKVKVEFFTGESGKCFARVKLTSPTNASSIKKYVAFLNGVVCSTKVVRSNIWGFYSAATQLFGSVSAYFDSTVAVSPLEIAPEKLYTLQSSAIAENHSVTAYYLCRTENFVHRKVEGIQLRTGSIRKGVQTVYIRTNEYSLLQDSLYLTEKIQGIRNQIEEIIKAKDVATITLEDLNIFMKAKTSCKLELVLSKHKRHS